MTGALVGGGRSEALDTRACVPDGAGEPRLAWSGDTVGAGDHELFVRSVGGPESPPAVFVHGLGGTSSNWTDLMGLLSGRIGSSAPDLPGFGRSEPPRGFGYTLDEYAGAVSGFISARHGAPVHLFGNSLGGAIATRIAAERPELVRTLTLISPALPTLRARKENLLVGLFAVPVLGARLIGRLRSLTAEELIQRQMARVLYDASRVPAARVEEAVRELEQTLGSEWTDRAFVRSTRGLLSAYLARGPRALWRQAATVKTPTLLLWGRHDQLVSLRLAGQAAAAFPNSRLLVLGDAGHVAQIERPDAVARAFIDLLNDLERGRGP